MNCFIKSLNEGRGKHILELMNNNNCQQSTGCETVLFQNKNKPDNHEKKELGLNLIIPDENQENIRPAENEIVLFEENNNSSITANDIEQADFMYDENAVEIENEHFSVSDLSFDFTKDLFDDESNEITNKGHEIQAKKTKKLNETDCVHNFNLLEFSYESNDGVEYENQAKITEDVNDTDYVPNLDFPDSESNNDAVEHEVHSQNNDINDGITEDPNDTDYIPNPYLPADSSSESSDDAAVNPELVDVRISPSEEKKNSRKRVRNEKLWAKNIKKIKISKGESYKTKSGKLVGKKSLKEGCGEKCRLKCGENLTLDNRKTLLNDFLRLGDVNRKRDFISKLLDEVNPKYCYKKENSTRTKNYSYHFIVNGNKVRVCKKMFTDTFCVSPTYLTTVKNKTTPTGVVSEDLRGKHMKQRKIHPLIVQSIHDHINSFARIESHYCRADNSREFIDGDLTISEMYRLYKIYCTEKGMVQYAKKHKYEEIFNTKYNIGFFVPKKDQCAFCARVKNSTDEENLLLEKDFETHMKEKELSRKEKEEDKQASRSEDSNNMVACFDLQAVIQLPKGEISAFYYKRKLNTFNFTVYDMTSKQGYCYVWHEGCAKRGALEIASYIFDFLKEHCKGKSVTFYSDNCSGQNKNHLLLAMYSFAVKTLDITSITHKYLIVGHTQNEGDSMHSSIERQIKRATRKTPLYVPSQLVAVMQTAIKEKTQFQVKEMDTHDVLDWHLIERSLGKNFQYSSSGDKVVWADIKVFKVNKEAPLTVFYKNSFEEKSFSSFNIDDKIVKRKDGRVEVQTKGNLKPRTSTRDRKGKLNTSVSSASSEEPNLRPAYQAPPGITQLKKADLISLCQTKLIPTPYHNFYHALMTTED